jgi:hypothetical protein
MPVHSGRNSTMKSRTAALHSARSPVRATTKPSAGSWFGSLTGLFGKSKPKLPDSSVSESTQGLSRMDATLPVVGLRDQERVTRATPSTAAKTSPRAERIARREQVFQLVRESMVRSGVLSSGYKFKVLSVDQRGAQFMVMMDLAAEFGGQTERLAEIEALIAQTAKQRYNVLVQAVYWRFSDHVVLGRPEDRHAAVPEAPRPKAQRFDPLLEDEVAAFKRALQLGTAPPEKTRAVPQVGRGLLLTGYEDTEVADESMVLPALSPTQYGDLPMR